MQIQITARQFHASDRLHDYARTKLERLGKFYDGITGIHVIMSKDGHPESSLVEVNANVHRQKLVANAQGRTHEEAIDECVSIMKRQVKRYKDKRREIDKSSVRHMDPEA